LKEIESCWGLLAAAVARANAHWPVEELSRAARQAIQHLLFVGVAETVGLLPQGALEAVAAGIKTAGGLGELLAAAQDRLGVGLFAVPGARPGEPPARSRSIVPAADAASLRSVLERLTRPETRAALASQPASFLGQVHQRLVGNTLERTADGRLLANRSAGVRRAVGLFYTPDYVAEYMAARAISRWERDRGRRGRQAGRCRILDPACGCGAFLLAAYRELTRRKPSRGSPAAPPERMRSIHGIDLDPEAVLVARRAMLLEAAALDASVFRPGQARQRRSLARETAEVLAENIRCADALADDAGAVKATPFDLVLGNPPYCRERGSKPLLDRVAATELGRRCRTARMDFWYYFAHRGLEWLRAGGRLSFIVGSYWTAAPGAEKLIRTLHQSCHVDEIVLLDRLKVFPGVSGRHLILSLRKGPAAGRTTIKRPLASGPTDAEPLLRGLAPVESFRKTRGQLFHDGRLDLEPPCDDELVLADGRCEALGSLGIVRQGIVENPASVTAEANRRHGGRWRVGEGVFALGEEELSRLGVPERERCLLRPYHDLRDLGRYYLAPTPSLALIYATRHTCPDVDRFPAIRAHLGRFRPLLESRRETRRGVRPWWQLHWPRDERLWLRPKIVALQMAERPAFVPASVPVYVPLSANVFLPREDAPEHLNYFAAVLNSRLLWRWFRRHAKGRGVGLEINGHVLVRAPVRRIDFADPAQKARHDRLVELVDEMLGLTRRLRAGGSQGEGDLARRQAEVDRRIDAVVEEVYGV